MPSGLRAFWGDDPITEGEMNVFQERLADQIKKLMPKADVNFRRVSAGKLRLGVTMPGVRKSQSGNTVLESLALDLAPGPRTPFGRTVAMEYQTGWARIFGAEIIAQSEQEMEFRDPFSSFANYLKAGLELGGRRSFGEWGSRLESIIGKPEQSRKTQVAGGLQMIGPWHSQEARMDIASRVTLSVPPGEFSDPYVSAIAERTIHAHSLGIAGQRTSQQAAFANLIGHAPLKEKTGVIRWRRVADIMDTGEVAVLGKKAGWFKHLNIANISFGSARERAGLYQMLTGEGGRPTGIEEIQPEFVTGSGYAQTAGLRWSNLQGAGGQRISGMLAPNTAFIPGFPYSGSTMFYREPWNRPGGPAVWSGGIPRAQFEPLSFTEDIRRLRGAQFEFGQFDIQEDEAGQITDYTRTGGLEGRWIEPGEEMTIGMASYREGDQTMYERIRIGTGSGRYWMDPSSINIRLPYEYEAATGRGTGGLATAEMEKEGIHQAGGYLTTAPILRDLQRQNPGINFSRQTTGNVGVYISGVMETGTGWKAIAGSKQASMAVPSGMTGREQVSVSLSDTMSQTLTAVAEYAKNPLEQFKWQFGFSSPAMQHRWVGAFGGRLGERLQQYVRQANKNYRITGEPAALDPNEMADIWAEERQMGLVQGNVTQYQMFSELMDTMQKLPPEESYRRYKWAANLPEQDIETGYISSSQRALLRSDAATALQNLLQNQYPKDETAPSIYSRQGRQAFIEHFGESPWQMRERTIKFERPIISHMNQPVPAPWKWSLRASPSLGTLATAPSPEYATRPGSGLGYEELAAMLAEQPIEASAVGADPRMGPIAQAGTGRVTVPPHQRAWRSIIETTRGNQPGAQISGRKAITRTELSEDTRRLLQTELMLNPDLPLSRVDEIIGGEGQVYNPASGLYSPRPSDIEAISKYRYEDEETQSLVTGLTHRYRAAMPELFSVRNYAGGPATQGFYGALQQIVEAKGVQKLHQARYIAGTMGGRYGAQPALELFEGVANPEMVRRAIRDIGKAQGLEGDELNRWANLAEESATTAVMSRYPNIAREQALTMTMYTPSQLRAQRGLITPEPSRIIGGMPRLGSLTATGIAGSFGLQMAGIGGDWDYDPLAMLILGRFDKNKGLIFPEGFKAPSEMDWFEQVRSVQRVKQNIFGDVSKFDPIVGAMEDLFTSKGAKQSADYLTFMAPQRMLEESKLLIKATMGMGVSYNLRRSMEASGSVLGRSPAEIQAGHSASALTYQPYLDKILKDIERRGGFTGIETLMGSARFTKRGNEAALIGKMGAESKWSFLWTSGGATTEDFTRRIAGPLGGIAEADKLSPELAAYYFGTEATPAGPLIERFKKQGIRSTLEEMAEVGSGRTGIAGSLQEYFGQPVPEGGGDLYDIQQTVAGFNLIASASEMTAGRQGKAPKMIDVEGEMINVNAAVEGLVFPMGRTQVPMRTREEALRKYNRISPRPAAAGGEERTVTATSRGGRESAQIEAGGLPSGSPGPAGREEWIQNYISQGGFHVQPQQMVDVSKLAQQSSIQRHEGLYNMMTRSPGGHLSWSQYEALEWQSTSQQAQGITPALLTQYALATYEPTVGGQPLPGLHPGRWGLGQEPGVITSQVEGTGPGALHGRAHVERQPVIPFSPISGGTGQGNRGGRGAGTGGLTPEEGEFWPFWRGGKQTSSGLSLTSNLGRPIAELLGGMGGGGGSAEDIMIALRAMMGDEEAQFRMDVRHVHQGQGMLSSEAERRMHSAYASAGAMKQRGMGQWGVDLMTQIGTLSGVTVNPYRQGGLPDALSAILEDPTVARIALGGQFSTIKEMAGWYRTQEAAYRGYQQENWRNVPDEYRRLFSSVVEQQGEYAELGAAGYAAAITYDALKGVGLGTASAMSGRGQTGETADEFIDRMDRVKEKLEEFGETISTTSSEVEKYKAVHEKKAYELEQLTLPKQQYRVEQLERELGSGLLGTADTERLQGQLTTARTQLSATEDRIEREKEMAADPSGRARFGREMSTTMRRLIGGWGLFYLGHLAQFPMQQWQYGMQEGMQFAQQQEAYMGGMMGGGLQQTPYSQIQNQIAQARIVSGGLPGAYMQQMQAVTPPGMRDLGGSLMAGAAAYAGSLYVAQAVGTETVLGDFLNKKAPLIGLAGLAAGVISSQMAYSQYPEQTRARLMGGFAKLRGQGSFIQDLATQADIAYTTMLRGQPGADDYITARSLEFSAQGILQGGGYGYIPVNQRGVPYRDASGDVINRPLTRQEKFTMATGFQALPQFQGLDPNILSQTAARWLSGPSGWTGAQLRQTVEAQMAGIDVVSMAQTQQQVLRQPTAPSAQLETIMAQQFQTVYQAAQFQTGAGIVGGMPAAQVPIYINTQDPIQQANQIAEMRRYQQTGMDTFLAQQGQLVQNAWAWGLPADETRIPADATPQERQELSIRYARLGTGQQLMTDYLTRGMKTPFMQSMISQMGGRVYGQGGRGGYKIIPSSFSPQQLAQMGRTNQFQEALVQAGIPGSYFTPEGVDRMMATAGGTALAMGGVDLFTKLQSAGLDTGILGGAEGFEDFGQQALASMAAGQGLQLRGMGVSAEQADVIMKQMKTGYGAASYIQQMFQGNPITMADAASNMGWGAPGSGQYQWSLANATVGSDLFGQVNGLPLFQMSLWQGSITPQQTAARIFGQNWGQSGGVSAAVYGWNIKQGRQATQGEWGQPGVVGGMWGMQARMNQISYEAQMAQAGIQMAQLNLSYAFTTGIGLEGYSTADPRTGQPFNIQGSGGFWGVQDRQRDLAHRQALWGFEYQERQFAMQGTQFMENWQINRQQSEMQRGWTRADWGVQDQTRALQWQWKQEDFAENIRFMTGRERKLATRQMERETTMHGLEGERTDTQRGRQREQWALEDERFDMQRRHHEEQRQLLEENMEKQKEFYEEGKELQDQATELQRAYFIENHKLQQAAIGAQAAYAAKMKEAQEEMILLQQEQDIVQGKYRVSMTLEAQFVNNIIDGLNHLIKHAHNLWEKIKSGEGIPGWTPDTGEDPDPKPNDGRLAVGGPLMAGRGSIVGEAGVEFAKSRVPMSIVPNNEFVAALLGGRSLEDPWERMFVGSASPQGGGNVPQTIVINIGNHRLGEFVVDAVKSDLAL